MHSDTHRRAPYFYRSCSQEEVICPPIHIHTYTDILSQQWTLSSLIHYLTWKPQQPLTVFNRDLFCGFIVFLCDARVCVAEQGGLSLLLPRLAQRVLGKGRKMHSRATSEKSLAPLIHTHTHTQFWLVTAARFGCSWRQRGGVSLWVSALTETALLQCFCWQIEWNRTFCPGQAYLWKMCVLIKWNTL